MRRDNPPDPPVDSVGHGMTHLLIILLLVLMVYPLQNVMGVRSMRFVSSLILVAGVYVTSKISRRWWRAFALATPALIANWIYSIGGILNDTLMTVEFVFWIAFLVYICFAFLARVLGRTEVTFETISGALCVYILLGLAWALGYGLMLLYMGDALVLTMTGEYIQQGAAASARDLPILIYFSFITQTTVGYGDIVPANSLAQSMASVEALVGQIYLAVLVARLVGLQVALRVSRQTRS